LRNYTHRPGGCGDGSLLVSRGVSGFELIARLADAFAWPVLALIMVLVLRHPLAQLLAHRPPFRVKAGPFEVEWERVLAETETEVQALPAESPAAAEPAPSLRDELAAEAQNAPAVAVLEAYSQVERELREIVSDVDPYPQRLTHMSAVGLARLAQREERVTPETTRAVHGLSVLRNLAAHGSAREITPEQASEYLDLVDAVLFALRQPPRKT
jgi:hypothetical protein